jgi:phosphoglycolate phosphatase-like HAD superfamily hydrolase
MPSSRDQSRHSRKAVVLDVDGTVVDSNDAHAQAWIDAFRESGIPVDDERVRRTIGMGADKLIPHVAGISADSPEGGRISARRAEIFTSRYLPGIRPFPQIRLLVQRFVDDGYTVVVASSAKEEEIRVLLERADVADLIDSQTSADDAERSKPDPDIVQAAIARSGAALEAVVMLGDTPYDVDAAHRAGIPIVALESGGWRRDDLVGAIEVYRDPAELCAQYDRSLFAHLAVDDLAAPRPPIDMNVVALIAGGVAGAALILLAVRALARRRSPVEDDGPVDPPRPTLSARDRERLRRLIERTS